MDMYIKGIKTHKSVPVSAVIHPDGLVEYNCYSGSGWEKAHAVEVDSADVVPWEWLERYAHGMRMNYASEWVQEARKRYEDGIH